MILFNMPIESDDLISQLSSIDVVGNLLDRMDESVLNGFSDNSSAQTKATTKKHSLETAFLFHEIIKPYDFADEINEALILGALLHDAGKTLIPAEYLYSAAQMNPDVIRLMKSHSENGAEIIHRVSQFDLQGNTPNFKQWQWDTAIAMASLHHNFKNELKFCYPKDDVIADLLDKKILSGKSVDVIKGCGIGEVFAICDVFSAVSAGRPYSKRRLNDELLTCPDDYQDVNEKCNSISDVVRYEIKLSRLGEHALDRLSECYCTYNR